MKDFACVKIDGQWGCNRLRAELRELQAALKPFADYAAQIDENWATKNTPDGCPVGLAFDADSSKAVVHLSDLRRAREVLSD